MKENIWEQIGLPHIYMIINNVNGKKYIGQHSGNNINYVCSGIIIRAALRKYGKKSFSRIILEVWNEAPENLDEIEATYIKLYETLIPIGYNISELGTGRKQYGNVPWNKGGNKFSEESRRKMSISHTGKVLESEHKKKISQSLVGKSKTNEHKLNIRKAQGRIVQQWTIEGVLINEYPAASFAAEVMECKRESIRDACVGKIKLCKGYKWTYKN